MITKTLRLATVIFAMISNLSFAQTQNQLAECQNIEATSTKMTPLDLWGSIPTCVAEDKFDQAVFMFGLAGSLGVFDSMRVSDPSARQAAKVLPMLGMSAMGKEKSLIFQKTVQSQFGDASKRAALCSALKIMPTPSYFPGYMINHGLVNMAGSNSDPFVINFNANEAWPKAINSYLMCPNG